MYICQEYFLVKKKLESKLAMQFIQLSISSYEFFFMKILF